MNGGRLSVFFAGLVERLLAMAAGSVAARAESDAALAEAESLDRLETAAQRYDEAGKPQVAERLRQRAAALSVDSPGAMASTFLPAPSAPAGQLPAPTTESTPSAPRRRRSRHASEREE